MVSGLRDGLVSPAHCTRPERVAARCCSRLTFTPSPLSFPSFPLYSHSVFLFPGGDDWAITGAPRDVFTGPFAGDEHHQSSTSRDRRPMECVVQGIIETQWIKNRIDVQC
nr:uncharacterized protein LOC117853066 [Setaria viridis]